MKILIIFLLFTACQAPEEQSELRSSPSASRSSKLAPSKWTSSFPLKIKIGSDFTGDELQALQDSAEAWNLSNESKTIFFETEVSEISGRNTLDDFKDSELGIYKLYSWPEDMPGTALAVTQIFGKKAKDGFIRINHADVLLNYDYFDFSTDDSWGYDLQTVVVHELGHLLGLYHENSSAEETVMFPTISRYRNNRAPLENDEKQIAKKYPQSQARAIASQPKKLIYQEQEIEEDVVFLMEIHKDGTEIYRRSH